MSLETTYVVLRLGSGLYAAPVARVEEMLELPDVTRTPSSPAECRGVINLRGRVVAVKDLRVLLDMVSRRAEHGTIDLAQRERDHVVWVDTLEACVDEGREFALAKDPTLCAFGRWYATFETNNAWLQTVMGAFNEPHRALHASADTILDLAKAGEMAGARDALATLRGGTLAVLQGLFAKAAEALEVAYREVAVVLRDQTGLLAVTADEVVAVEDLAPADAASAAHVIAGTGGMVDRLLSRPGTGELVLRLDVSAGGPLMPGTRVHAPAPELVTA